MLRAGGQAWLLHAGDNGGRSMRMPLTVTTPAGGASDAVANELWAELRERLHAFVLRRVGDPTVAEDLVQEIVLRLYANLGRLREVDRLDAFAYQIARNLIADHWRARQARREEPLTDEMAQWLEAPADEPADELSGDLRREVAGCLAPMVRRLPAPYREALELTDLGEHTQAEAAELLGLSLPGLKSRVQRGRDQVRGLLRSCCEVAQDARGQVTGFERPDECSDSRSTGSSCCS